MKEKHGHSHHYQKDDRRSTSQPGVLDQFDDNNPFNNEQIEGLINKTSEIDQLTANTIYKDFRYTAVWIGLTVIAGMALLYFFLF